jgi:hypothetical protein
MVKYVKDIFRKKPYLAKLRSVTGNDELLGVISEWEKQTGKSFLKVAKGTPRRLGSEGVGGWARDAISGKHVMIIERDVFRHEVQATIEVTHELAYEAVWEGQDLAMPHLNIPAPMRNAMQWVEAVLQHGDRAYDTLLSLGEHLTE